MGGGFNLYQKSSKSATLQIIGILVNEYTFKGSNFTFLSHQ